MKNKSILGLIPARGGSKGIPRKNLFNLKNKPLIQWTIETAMNYGDLNKIIVSTDDKSIAEFAQLHGAEVPFFREKKLAQDDSNIIDTVLDLLVKLDHFDEVLLLQPTSPLRIVEDIKNIIEIKRKFNADSVVSVCEARHNPSLLFEIEGNILQKSFNNLKSGNRQNFKKYYALNGSLYLTSVEYLKKYKKFISKDTLPYIMPPERSIDIDSLFDVKLAEFLIDHRDKI